MQIWETVYFNIFILLLSMANVIWFQEGAVITEDSKK